MKIYFYQNNIKDTVNASDAYKKEAESTSVYSNLLDERPCVYGVLEAAILKYLWPAVY